MKDLVFLLYDNRSGSTFLSALLNRYSGVSVSQETDFVFRTLEYPKSEIGSQQELIHFADYLFGSTRFSELAMSRDAFSVCFASCTFPLTKRIILSQVLQSYFLQRDPDAILWVVKGPRTYFHMHSLNQMFPEVRYIHIVRDGRAVYASKSRTQKYNFETGEFHRRAVMDDNLLHAARKWQNKLRMAEKYRDRVVNVRYEDLLQDPQRSLDYLLDELQVPEPFRSLTKAQEDYAKDIFSGHKAVHTNVKKSKQESYAKKWMNLLNKEQIYVYERVNGGYLQRYGYDIMEWGKEQALVFKARCLLMTVSYTVEEIWSKLRSAFVSIFVYRSFAKLLRQKWYEFASNEAES